MSCQFRAAGAGSCFGELGVFAGFPGRSALFGEVCRSRWHPVRGNRPLPRLLARCLVPSQVGLPWGWRCVTHTSLPRTCQHQECVPKDTWGNATSLLPGQPRRGWAAWDVSGTHHFSKNRFSFFRLKQMSVSLPMRARCLAFPCSQAGVTSSKCGQTLLTMHR